MGKGKKGKKKEDDDWEDDIASIAKESGVDLNQEEEEDVVINIPKKKEKKRKDKASQQKESQIDEDAFESTETKSTKPSFSALMIEDEADDEAHDDVISSDDEGENKDERLEGDKESKIEDNSEKEPNKEQSAKSDKKKGKGSKKKKEEDEDLDAILADIESGEKKEGKADGKKSKKKGKQKHESEEEPEDKAEDNKESIEDVAMETDEVKEDKKEKGKKSKEVQEEQSDGEGPKLKTAAQKRAEKKEREKLKKKKEAKKKADKKEEKQTEEKTVEEEVADSIREESVVVESNIDETAQEAAGAVEEAGSDEEGEEGDGDKKKKKKKKKKGKDEDEKKKGKKPGKAAIKHMQEALEKLKLEEERLRQEEEAKQKAAEEAERQRLEKLRLEQERKEKKKQKEKEKREKLKKEGKLLTAAQKEQKRRAERMLEAMKQQGITVPSKDAVEPRKKVQYGKKKKNQQVERQNSDQPEMNTEVPTEFEEKTEQKIEPPQEREQEVKESTAEVEENVVETNGNEEEDDDLPESWEEHHDEAEDMKKKAINEPDKKKSEVKEIAQQVEVEKNKTDMEEPKEKTVKDEDSEEADEEEEESSEDESEEESSEEESESSEEEHEKLTPEKIKERARERIMKRREDAEAKRTINDLRCPVICVLGHVDTGKTKILDKIRHTNVQDGEAGGITQQIGATMVPLETLKTQTKMVKEFQKFDLKLPGLLIIDTPGHESFSNLRTRGSSLCDMAILVVDIMHGLEPQTIESINLLRKKHTPFIVALNKIDRLFEWKRGPASQVEDTVKKQKRNTKTEFESRVQQVVGEFAEQGLNAELFYKNFDEKSYISLVPTSAHSGDGMGDLMALICKLTQTRLAKKLAYSEELQGTVMEVKSLPGLGTTVDAILVNGKLKEGDTIVTGGIEGPIVTQVRAVLTPQPLRELRVKSNYIQHKELKAAQGCKITGKDLEKVMAGAPIFVAEHPDEIDVLKDEVNEIVRSSLKAIKVSDRGVYVQASTLGSLEALLEFLKTSKIPYSGVNVGPVHKRDVMKTSVMLEHEPMYAVVLAFDVKVERDAQDLADKEGIKIFTADIIYHLFDKFTAYTEDYKQKLKDKHKHLAIFPCKLRVLPQHIFNSRDPIVIGVNIESGSLRLGTPITVPSKEFCDIGVVAGIEANHKTMEKAVAGQEVCIKIEPTGDAPRMYGRHFTHEDLLMSKISRESIDALKNYFRDEMSKADWQLIIEMKKTFDII